MGEIQNLEKQISTQKIKTDFLKALPTCFAVCVCHIAGQHFEGS
jgi:hypothetical protein